MFVAQVPEPKASKEPRSRSRSREASLSSSRGNLRMEATCARKACGTDFEGPCGSGSVISHGAEAHRSQISMMLRCDWREVQ